MIHVDALGDPIEIGKRYDSGTELRNLTAIEQPKYSVEAASAILWTLRQMTK